MGYAGIEEGAIFHTGIEEIFNGQAGVKEWSKYKKEEVTTQA